MNGWNGSYQNRKYIAIIEGFLRKRRFKILVSASECMDWILSKTGNIQPYRAREIRKGHTPIFPLGPLVIYTKGGGTGGLSGGDLHGLRRKGW